MSKKIFQLQVLYNTCFKGKGDKDRESRRGRSKLSHLEEEVQATLVSNIVSTLPWPVIHDGHMDSHDVLSLIWLIFMAVYHVWN